MNYRKIIKYTTEAEALQLEINNYYALLGGNMGILFNNKEVREVIENKIKENEKNIKFLEYKIRKLIEI